MGRYKWAIGEPPPPIEPHSISKHNVLKEYLRKYVQILTKNPKVEQLRISLIDGFSGGGKYIHSISNDEVDGSPLIMLKAMEEVEREIAEERIKEFAIAAKYFFVDADKRAVNYLENELNKTPYKKMIETQQISLIRSDFETASDSIIAEIQKHSRSQRAIFLLDQYGYKDVPMPLLRKIFSSLENAEVLLTFSIDWLIDYMSNTSQFKELMNKTGLQLPLGNFEKIKANQRHSWRRIVQTQLHKELFFQSGARFYTPFFIYSEKANRTYWFIHLSNHIKARDVMVDLHWTFQNHFLHYGGSGLNMLGYDPRRDIDLTGQMPFGFDSIAMNNTIDSLLVDIPREYLAIHGTTSFGKLLSDCANESPANTGIIQEVFSKLIDHGEVEVVSDNGGKRRMGHTMKSTDIITLRRQMNLFTFSDS